MVWDFWSFFGGQRSPNIIRSVWNLARHRDWTLCHAEFGNNPYNVYTMWRPCKEKMHNCPGSDFNTGIPAGYEACYTNTEIGSISSMRHVCCVRTSAICSSWSRWHRPRAWYRRKLESYDWYTATSTVSYSHWRCFFYRLLILRSVLLLLEWLIKPYCCPFYSTPHYIAHTSQMLYIQLFLQWCQNALAADP